MEERLKVDIMTREVLEIKIAYNVINLFIKSKGEYFLPSHFGEDETNLKEFQDNEIDNIIKLIMNEFVWLSSKRKYNWYSFVDNKSYEIRKIIKQPFGGITISISKKHIDRRDIINSLLYLADDLFIELNADYARIVYKSPEEQDPIRLEKYIGDIYWRNYFGKKYIELFGREKLLSAPCYKIYELKDCIVLQSTETIEETRKPEYEEIKRRIKKHLGERAFKSGKSLFRGWKAPDFSIKEK